MENIFFSQDGLCQVNIDSSTSIFIPGGSGGVGHFSVQIARIRGAKQIITSASKDDGIRILKEQYKINDVINYAKEDVVARVLELSENQGVDIAYDSTYVESSFAQSLAAVRQGGTWIVLGDFAEKGSREAKEATKRKIKIIHADISDYWLESSRVELYRFCRNSLRQGVQWLEEGKLKPYINQTIKLEDVQNALETLKQGKGGFGKIVVKFNQ